MDLKNQRVLITGGTGFIGSHLVERLVREGCRVRVLGNYKSQPDVGNLAYLERDVLDSVEIVWGDVCDRDSATQVLDGVAVVFHLAALIGIPYSYVAPSSYVQTNIGGTLNVLQAARAQGVAHMVHTSTSEVYGSAQYTPIDERHPQVGQSPYSASKIGADKIAESFFHSFELPVTTVRPFNVFGPRQSDRAIIPTVIAQRVASQDPVRIGDPAPKRDFTFVTDTVDGFVRAATCDQACGRTLNISNGKSISIGELTELICELTDGGQGCDAVGERHARSAKPPTAAFVSESMRVRPAGSEVSELLGDSTAARDVLAWKPSVSLRDGLLRTIEFVREHPERFTPKRYRV